MTIATFTLSVLLLLATPGPTNTLMALAGYRFGVLSAMRLIPAEILGYLFVIIPVTCLVAPLFEEWPLLSDWTKLVAGIWVLYLAIRLWRFLPDGPQKRDVDARAVFLTTCLNPKALIIALVLMPHDGLLSILPWAALFSGLVLVGASVWICLGSLIARSDSSYARPLVIRRAAATGLLIFAVILTGTSLGAMV
jgi:threonine/homoserine/homoserine lactone efflux protein